MTDHHHTMTERSFGETLRDRRRQLGLSQAQAAHVVGASEKSWRRWEQGAMPEEGFLEAIAYRFQIALGTPNTPRSLAIEALTNVERTVASIRDQLEHAPDARADLFLGLPDGSVVLARIEAFPAAESNDVRSRAVAVIRGAALEAGWTFHVAP